MERRIGGFGKILISDGPLAPNNHPHAAAVDSSALRPFLLLLLLVEGLEAGHGRGGVRFTTCSPAPLTPATAALALPAAGLRTLHLAGASAVVVLRRGAGVALLRRLLRRPLRRLAAASAEPPPLPRVLLERVLRAGERS